MWGSTPSEGMATLGTPHPHGCLHHMGPPPYIPHTPMDCKDDPFPGATTEPAVSQITNHSPKSYTVASG